MVGVDRWGKLIVSKGILIMGGIKCTLALAKRYVRRKRASTKKRKLILQNTVQDAGEVR
jgi:hypothetical protein